MSLDWVNSILPVILEGKKLTALWEHIEEDYRAGNKFNVKSWCAISITQSAYYELFIRHYTESHTYTLKCQNNESSQS